MEFVNQGNKCRKGNLKSGKKVQRLHPKDVKVNDQHKQRPNNRIVDYNGSTNKTIRNKGQLQQNVNGSLVIINK